MEQFKNLKFTHSKHTKFAVKVLLFVIIIVVIAYLASNHPPSYLSTQTVSPSGSQSSSVTTQPQATTLPTSEPASSAQQCSLPWSSCPKKYYCNRKYLNPVCEKCPTDNIPRHCPCGKQGYGKCGYGATCQETFPGVKEKECL